jgi:hypothetical protein
MGCQLVLLWVLKWKFRGKARRSQSLFSGPPSNKTLTAPMNLSDPGVRATIIKQYDKYGERFTIEEYGVNRERVRAWKELFTEFGSFDPRFDLRGAKSLLTPVEIRKLESELIKNTRATNADLASKIKNKITPREVGKIINKSDKEFTWKLENVDVEETFSPEIVEEGKKFLKEIHNIPYEDRIYVDETFESAGIKRRMVRVPKNKKAWSPRNRKYTRFVIIGAITKDGWLHPGKLYNKTSISDNDFDAYVKKVLAPKLTPGKVVFWDQYGKFGRVKNPTARHFSPAAKKAIEARGAKLKMLTRYGKYFDPIECVFGDTKKIYDKKLVTATRSVMPSKLSFATKAKLWREAEKEVKSNSFHRAFKERASGKEFFRVYKERELMGNKP